MLENRFVRCTRCEHAENMFNGDPTATHDRLATEYARIDGDALEKIDFVHGEDPDADVTINSRPTLSNLRRQAPARIQ